MNTNIFKWVLGGLSGIILWDLFFTDDVFVYIKKPFIEVTHFPPFKINGITVNQYGKTVPYLKYEFEIVQSNGKYNVVLKKFEVTSIVYINEDTSVFRPIEEFRQYFRPNRDYVHSDYDSSFNTFYGTIYHEKLHQDEFEIVFNEYKRKVKNDLKTFVSNNKDELSQRAKDYFEKIRLEFDGTAPNNVMNTPEAIKRHAEIDLKEWKHLHDLYVEARRKNGK